jgi:hypothetical protein
MITWPFSRPEPDTAPVAPPIRAGHGTTITVNSLGVALSAPGAGPTFPHPWRPSLTGTWITLRQGTVSSFAGDNVYTPKIRSQGKLVSMVGDQRTPPPRLKLDPQLANKAGESWIVLEVAADPNTGEILQTSRVEIVHSGQPISHKLNVGRQPLTQILWKNGRPLRAIAITHWNLRYLRIADSVGTRHLFL